MTAPVRRTAAEQFGPYRLESLIGRGGMGEVHRAFDTRRERVVALKRLPAALAADAEFRARFARESRLAARLREPHVIPIHDFGEIGGRLFIDMRLVEGTDLATVLTQQGPLPPARAIAVLAQVAGALDAAHADGLVHRDVKPSNVLLSRADFVYLIDFGIARAAEGTHLTATGATIGTASYMAPERFTGHGVGDHLVDVYALGCLLHELLTGTPPFPGEGFAQQMYAHLNVPPPRPSAQRADVPADLDAVVAGAMAKRPEQRYRRAGDVVVAARAVLEGVAAVPPPRKPQPDAGARAHRAGATGHPADPDIVGQPTRLPTPPTHRETEPPAPVRRGIDSLIRAVGFAAVSACLFLVVALIAVGPPSFPEAWLHVGLRLGVGIALTTVCIWPITYRFASFWVPLLLAAPLSVVLWFAPALLGR